MFRYTLQSLLIPVYLLLFSACGNTRHQNHTINYGILFEDAEEALNPDWIVQKGDSFPRRVLAHNDSTYCIYLPVSWYQDENQQWHNPHEYHLPMYQEDNYILTLDVGGTGMEVPHYKLGVILDTAYGRRTILWDSWYNHQGIKAHMQEGTMVFPSPIELVRGYGYESTTKWSHFQVNLEEYLHYFEPNNDIYEVETFVATGGNLDNIRLTH